MFLVDDGSTAHEANTDQKFSLASADTYQIFGGTYQHLLGGVVCMHVLLSCDRALLAQAVHIMLSILQPGHLGTSTAANSQPARGTTWPVSFPCMCSDLLM